MHFKKKNQELSEIILGMRTAYAAGKNSMAWCRNLLNKKTGLSQKNELLAILVAYDLQAGSYVTAARAKPDNNLRWCQQIGSLLERTLKNGDSILEVGVGEATTLAGVLKKINLKLGPALGFDISWSRLAEGKIWLKHNCCKADLFVADLFNIPLADDSIDVVYTSHSLEPNRGREVAAIAECLRIARRAVLLFEPIFELASSKAQARMRKHGYIEGLKRAAEHLGAKVVDYRLLEYSSNSLNPSGILHLKKKKIAKPKSKNVVKWQCPVTGVKLDSRNGFFYAPQAGLAYPVFRKIPMLRADHAIVASKILSLSSA